jgi:hypothetical protein
MQTFAQDLRLVPYLPRVPTIVFIGIDIVRFVSPPSDPDFTLPAPGPIPADYSQHFSAYIETLPHAQKAALVTHWVRVRYPVFKQNYAHNLGVLKELIEACRARGLHPVLLDTPRNTTAMGRAFDEPVARYRASCKELAAEYGIPFLDMVAGAQFEDHDFFDLWHALPSARAKWQPRLARETVRLLRRFAMNGALGSLLPLYLFACPQ